MKIPPMPAPSHLPPAALLAVVLLASCSAEPAACTNIGCGASVTLPNLATASGADVLALTVRLCRNGVCSEGAPAELPGAPGTGAGCRLTGDLAAQCTVWSEGPGRYRLEAAFLDLGDLRGGDRYTVRVVHRPSGVVLAEADGAPPYTTRRPNGPQCEPVCHQATLPLTTRPVP